MSLDFTAREANVRDSVKKYFIDNLNGLESLALTFDKGLSVPRVQGTEVDKWVAIQFGALLLDTLSSQTLTIFCCTKKDSEGFKLAQLRDKVYTYLIDTEQTDGTARITLYRSHASEIWESLGAMMVSVLSESPQMEAEDGSKFKTIDILLRWGTIC